MATSGAVLGVDEANGVQYRVLTPADCEEATETMAEAFSQGEPTTKLLGGSKSDWLAFCRLYVPRMAAEGSTVIAVDTSSKRILGGFLAEDFVAPDPPELDSVCAAMDSDWTPTFECIAVLEESLKSRYGDAVPGRMFHQWLLGVAPEGRGRGIAAGLTSHLLKLAERKGYELSFAECTGAVSTHILGKLGATAEHFVDYAEFQSGGAAVFAPLVAEGHKGMSLMVVHHRAREEKKAAKLRKPTWIKVKDVKPDSKGVNLMLKVIKLEEEADAKSRAWHVVAGDETAVVTLRLINEEHVKVCQEGASIRIQNGRVLMRDGFVRVIVDKWGVLKAAESPLQVQVKTDKDVSATEYELGA